MFCAGGTAANIGLAVAHTKFHAQNTTPNATAMAAVTTMSTVRQVRLVLSVLTRLLLRDFDDEQDALFDGHACGKTCDDVGQAERFPEGEKTAGERVAQTARRDAADVAADRHERDGALHRAAKRQRFARVRGAQLRLAVHSAQAETA